MAVEAMVTDPSLRFVCIREVQRSLKFSAKSLIESKIRSMGVSDLFQVLTTEIRHRLGPGLMIFEGMQDHTADSIKSLEGFRVAWVEEAQNISKRSMTLLIPTIHRMKGSEIWFSWNPEQPTDPVDQLLVANPPEGAAVVHVNYTDNPWCPQEAIDEAHRMRALDPDTYAHVWEGGYNVRSDAQVLSGHWVIDAFDSNPGWDGPYFGADWGFSSDPTAISRSWVGPGEWGANCLWVDQEAGGVGIGLDDLPRVILSVPGAGDHTARGDPSRPDTIAYLAKHGVKIEAAVTGPGSVEEGVEYLRSFDKIVIHERCTRTQEEARLWRYKTDRLTGDPLPILVDKYNHWWDSIRYAHSPMIHARKAKREVRFR